MRGLATTLTGNAGATRTPTRLRDPQEEDEASEPRAEDRVAVKSATGKRWTRRNREAEDLYARIDRSNAKLAVGHRLVRHWAMSHLPRPGLRRSSRGSFPEAVQMPYRQHRYAPFDGH